MNHAHICTVHEIDEADGRTFIAMELLEPAAAFPAHWAPNTMVRSTKNDFLLGTVTVSSPRFTVPGIGHLMFRHK